MQKRAKGASYTDRFNQKGSVSDAKSNTGSKKGAAVTGSYKGEDSEGGKVSVFMNLDDIPDCDAFENATPSPRKPASSSNNNKLGVQERFGSRGVHMSQGKSRQRSAVGDTAQSFEVNEWGADDMDDMPQVALAAKEGGDGVRQQQYSINKPPVQQRVAVTKEIPPPMQPQRIPNLPSFRQPLAADPSSANPSSRGGMSGGSYRSTPKENNIQQSFNPSNDYTPFRYIDSSGHVSSAPNPNPTLAPSGGRTGRQTRLKDDDDDWSDNDVNEIAAGGAPAYYDNYDEYPIRGGGFEDDGYATGKAPARGSKAHAHAPQQLSAQYSNVEGNINQGKRQFNLDNKLAAGRRSIDRGSHHPTPSVLDVPALPCETDSSRAELSPKDKLAYSRQPREVEYKPYTLQQYKIIKPKEYVEICNLKPDLNTDELRAKRANLERIKEFSKNLKSFNEKMIESQSRKPPTFSEASAIEISKKKEDSSRERALQFAKNIPRPKIVQRAEEFEEIEAGYMRVSDEQFGMGRDKARLVLLTRAYHPHLLISILTRTHAAYSSLDRALMDLEAKYAESKRNVEAIKKAMKSGY